MITISYVNNDISKVVYESLKVSDIKSYLKSGMKVALKPNLVVPCPARDGATTHPEVVEGVIIFLREYGISDIKIIESSWVGDDTKLAFKYCGYEELSKRYNIPLIDLKSDTSSKYSFGDFEMSVCDEVMNTDFLINIPVLKAHCQTDLTCCLKNLKGCIPDREKRRYHTLGIHKPVAALNGIIKTGYCVIDGICGDLSFEEGGHPVDSKRIIMGADPLELDSYCATLIGYEPHEIGYIRHATDYGIGKPYSKSSQVEELNAEFKPLVNLKRDRFAHKYRDLITEDSACSACYSALVYALHRKGGESDKAIYIGQGFKGKSLAAKDGIGIGTCCSGFEEYIPGCPPKALNISKSPLI